MWWCNYYKRPLKDPLLKEYSIEDLMYEFHMVKEKRLYEKQLADEENDRIEEEKLQADEEWADMMEEEEEESTEVDPALDPQNIEWMEQQLEEAKLFFDDETFGEDLNLRFDDTED